MPPPFVAGGLLRSGCSTGGCVAAVRLRHHAKSSPLPKSSLQTGDGGRSSRLTCCARARSRHTTTRRSHGARRTGRAHRWRRCKRRRTTRRSRPCHKTDHWRCSSLNETSRSCQCSEHENSPCAPTRRTQRMATNALRRKTCLRRRHGQGCTCRTSAQRRYRLRKRGRGRLRIRGHTPCSARDRRRRAAGRARTRDRRRRAPTGRRIASAGAPRWPRPPPRPARFARTRGRPSRGPPGGCTYDVAAMQEWRHQTVSAARGLGGARLLWSKGGVPRCRLRAPGARPPPSVRTAGARPGPLTQAPRRGPQRACCPARGELRGREALSPTSPSMT